VVCVCVGATTGAGRDCGVIAATGSRSGCRLVVDLRFARYAAYFASFCCKGVLGKAVAMRTFVRMGLGTLATASGPSGVAPLNSGGGTAVPKVDVMRWAPVNGARARVVSTATRTGAGAGTLKVEVTMWGWGF
jgi:hypothetical protein